MTDIASSLEHEFASAAQAGRESTIAKLRQIEAAGRGSLDVRPHAIAMPLVFCILGALFVYAGFSFNDASSPILFVIGALLIAPSAWAMFGPRKPRFTLTEQGVRVKNVLLPWSGIRDYGVMTHSVNGLPTRTTVTLHHAEGFTPPALDVFILLGRSTRQRKTGLYATRLILHSGAKGMNGKKLAQRIGEFFAAAHARDELARLGAN